MEIPREILTADFPSSTDPLTIEGVQTAYSGPVPLIQLDSFSLLARAAGASWNKNMVKGVESLGARTMGAMKSLVAEKSFPLVQNIQTSISEGQVQVGWDPIENASIYEVEVRKSNSENTLISKSFTTNGNLLLPLPSNSGNFFVRVRAGDQVSTESGNESVWGNWLNSTGQNAIPFPQNPSKAPPVLTSPANGLETDGFAVILEWIKNPNTNYRVQVAKDSQFKDIQIDQLNSEGALKIPGQILSLKERYYWRAQIWESESSAWSSPREFIIGAPQHVHKDMFINPEAPQ